MEVNGRKRVNRERVSERGTVPIRVHPRICDIVVKVIKLSIFFFAVARVSSEEPRGKVEI
jgi:hypothetical protein